MMCKRCNAKRSKTKQNMKKNHQTFSNENASDVNPLRLAYHYDFNEFFCTLLFAFALLQFSCWLALYFDLMMLPSSPAGNRLFVLFCFVFSRSIAAYLRHNYGDNNLVCKNCNCFRNSGKKRSHF